MKPITQKALLAAAVFALAAGPTVAAEQQASQGEQSGQASQTSPHPGALVRGSKAIRAKIFSPKGEQVGTIDDLLFDPKSGQISYAVLGFGGFLGMGEKKSLVPWDKVREDVANPENYVVEVDQQKLKGAPSFEGDRWAEVTQPDYLKNVQNYFAGAGQQPSQAEQQQAQQAAEREAQRRQQQAQQQQQQQEGKSGSQVQTPPQ